MSSLDAHEIDDFVSRASAVHEAVQALARGDIDTTHTDQLLKDLETKETRKKEKEDPVLAQIRAERKAKEEEERKRKGVKGEGARPGYKYFCKHCFLEYELEPHQPNENGAPSPATSSPNSASAAGASSRASIPVCSNCSHPLQTREERMNDLMAKVSTMKAMKAERAARRKSFAAWKEKQRAEHESQKVVVLGPDGQPEKDESTPTSRRVGISYEDWDKWEPSSDEDTAVPDPDNPAFAAMKADMEQREAKKKAARQVADAANAQGNECIKKKYYLGAIEAYTRAINATRNEKSYYTNRALAFIHTFDYAAAIKDTTTALDLFDCFEKEHVRYTSDYTNMRLVLKAYLRRARAHLARNEIEESKADLARASGLIQDLYAAPSRQESRYAANRKMELAEVAKMIKECKEKEAFIQEEKKVKEAATAAMTGATSSAEGDKSDQAVATADAAASSTPSPVSSVATSALSNLHSSLLSFHQASLSTADPVSDASQHAHAHQFRELNWKLLLPPLNFLSALIDNDGNKEKLVAHKESRMCLHVLLNLLAARHGASNPSSQPSSLASSPSNVFTANRPLPDFDSSLSFVSPHSSDSSTNATAAGSMNQVWWREHDGFTPLGKYMHLLYTTIANSNNHETTGASQPLPPEILIVLLQCLMKMTDREGARVFFASATHAPLLTDAAVEVLSFNGQPSSVLSSSSISQQVDARRYASNLLANLAYQPSYRSWLCSSENCQRLGTIFNAVLDQAHSCALAGGKSSSSAAADSAHVLSSALTILINLFTHPTCRSRFIEATGDKDSTSTSSSCASSSSSTLLSRLTSILLSLSVAWKRQSYNVTAGSLLSELSEKVLSCMQNLTVDDVANTRLYSTLSHAVLIELLHLASQPASTSSSDKTASATSIRSSISPVLIERCMAIIARVLKREHQSTTSTEAAADKSSSRPLRQLVLQNDGLNAILRILALHSFASSSDKDAQSAESMMAELQRSNAPSPFSSAENSLSSSPSASFRYTRPTMDHASVCLAVCLASNPAACAAVPDFRCQGTSGLQLLVSLLSSTSVPVVCNACLALDALITSNPALIARPELGSSLVKLLTIIQNAAFAAAHTNAAKAAILIGRAPNNKEAWGRMRGLEIIAQKVMPAKAKAVMK